MDIDEVVIWRAKAGHNYNLVSIYGGTANEGPFLGIVPQGPYLRIDDITNRNK